jgi:lipoprotein-anchoring transpeptidase ErfK/SrfK
VASLALAAGCSGSPNTHPNGDATVPAATATVAISPADGATKVAPTGALRVTAAAGKLTRITVTAPGDTNVPGKVSADRTTWTPSRPLRTGTHYQVTATAQDSSGHTVTQQSAFTTLTPAHKAAATVNVVAGETYGVGMEVEVRFKDPVSDKAAVMRAITVSATPAVPVVGHWFGDDQVDFRPQQYWTPGTRATVHLRLDGVQTAPGAYGTQQQDITFAIGRSQISTIDDRTKQLQVVRDGKLVRTLPGSLGAPGHTTYNGQMVISEKYRVIDMDSRTVGLGSSYNIKDVPHAMRLTTSGTFIHGNYWRPSFVFGNQDTSHGCVGLRDVRGGGDPSTPAAWFYNNSLIGDVVIVKGTPDRTVQPGNGLNGWNMSWSAWTTTSS